MSQPRLPSLRKLGVWAGYALAIYGALMLLVPPVGWIYQKVSLADAVGFARPFCERYVVPTSDSTEESRWRDYRLIGISLWADAPLEQARFHFAGVNGVLRWHIATQELSSRERASFIADLPTRIVTGPVVSPPLPTLREGGRLTVSAIALVASDDECALPELFTVTTPTGKIYTSNPRQATLFMWPMPPSILTALVVGVVAGIGYALIYLWKKLMRAA